MIISKSNHTGVPSVLIKLSAEMDPIICTFEEIDVSWGKKKNLLVELRMVPGKTQDRKYLLQLMNIFIEHDPKFKKIIEEYGHQKQLKVR